jgi:hypothetical protein
LKKRWSTKILGNFRRGGVAGTQQPIYFDQRLFLGGHLVEQKGFPDGIAAGGTVDKQQLEFTDSGILEIL